MASTDKLSFIVTAGQSTGEIGSKATAEGDVTTASGTNSHAEGNVTTASGTNSHAEGYITTASGNSSHAEGYYAEASGSRSHAEGENTMASGNYSHAEGFFTKATGNVSHAEGGNTSSAGSVLGDITIDSSDIPALDSETITVKGPVAYGIQSHAEGSQTLAYGYSSHAEGYRTIASGDYSHAEGGSTTASGELSHAEGRYAEASGDYSHAEGSYAEASGDYSHAEGYRTIASGSYSHTEGSYAEASGKNSHAEGGNSNSSGAVSGDITIDSSDIPDLGSETITVKGPVAYGIQSHAEGTQTLAYGYSSHAEGYKTIASGIRSHAEGYNTIASGSSSHAEGYYAEASGSYSHAEGYKAIASGTNSHAEGRLAEASGASSHAEGYSTSASGDYSHAEGHNTTASSYQHAGGRYNSSTTGPTSISATTGSIFVLGKGTSDSARSNAFRIATTGAVYGNGAYNTSGADYAEYFEWKDKNTDNQDRVGLFVTLDGEYIRLANSDDDYILGVVSATPSVIGDSYFGDNWHGMYETDIFGRPIIETVHVEEYIDEETGEIVPAHDEDRWVLNPDWNHEQEYRSREDRSEWSAIGMLGKLIVIDDGTCKVNGYCKVADNGIATKSDDKSGYRVMARLDDTHIKILFR